MADQLQDFEQQNLQLEKDRLAFEIRKFDADQTKRQCEVEKLEEEIRELRRPWYKKAAYLSPIAAITVAIIGGMIAFGTDVFKSNVLALRSERDQLSQSVKDLTSAKNTLTAENDKLSRDNNELHKTEILLTSKVNELRDKAEDLSKDNNRLQVSIRDARKEKDALARDILVTELKTHLKIIRSLAPFSHLERSNQSLQNLFTIAEQSGSNPDAVSLLESGYNDPGSSPEVKGALCLALFKATGRPEWKTRLREFSIEQVIRKLRSRSRIDGLNRNSIFLALLADDSVFTVAEKVETLRTMYAVARTETGTLSRFYSLVDDPFYTVVEWDEDATVAFRDPWFDYVGRLHDLREWDVPLSANLYEFDSPRLLHVAPQAFGVLLLKSLNDAPVSVVTSDRAIPTGTIDLSADPRCPFFPESFPLCRDWAPPLKPGETPSFSIVGPLSPSTFRSSVTSSFIIKSSSLSIYRQWVHDNQELVSIWTDRTFNALRKVNDNVMRRILRGGWVETSELRGTSK